MCPPFFWDKDTSVTVSSVPCSTRDPFKVKTESKSECSSGFQSQWKYKILFSKFADQLVDTNIKGDNSEDSHLKKTLYR